MATRSDFAVVRVDAHFGDNAGDLSTSLPFVGNQKSVSFTIDGVPSGKGYILINSFDVDSESHQVQINGNDLPGRDLVMNAGANRRQTRMRDIPAACSSKAATRSLSSARRTATTSLSPKRSSTGASSEPIIAAFSDIG